MGGVQGKPQFKRFEINPRVQAIVIRRHLPPVLQTCTVQSFEMGGLEQAPPGKEDDQALATPLPLPLCHTQASDIPTDFYKPPLSGSSSSEGAWGGTYPISFMLGAQKYFLSLSMGDLRHGGHLQPISRS